MKMMTIVTVEITDEFGGYYPGGAVSRVTEDVARASVAGGTHKYTNKKKLLSFNKNMVKVAKSMEAVQKYENLTGERLRPVEHEDGTRSFNIPLLTEGNKPITSMTTSRVADF